MSGPVDEKPADHPGQGERLQQAASFYRAGNYADALLILEELARERPDSRHVMYSQGLCLAATGHLPDAVEICTRLGQCKGHTAELLTVKLRARIDEATLGRSHSHHHHHRRMPVFSLQSVFGLMRQPLGLLIGAVLFTGTILAAAALKGDPEVLEAQAVAPIARLAMPKELRAVAGGYLEIPVCYLSGQEEPVKYAIVFCPASEGDPGAGELNDAVGNEIATNWPVIRAQVDEALNMAVQQPEPIEGVARAELRRVAVIPREGLSLAGGLRGKTVERFTPGPSTTLRDLSAKVGGPDNMALWPQGTAVSGIEGDVCWWGRMGVATDDNGVITYLVVSVPADPPAPTPEPNSEPTPSSN